jgi:TATA-binding protein-associated factor
MAQQSSRLHRLLTLLDAGSTQATRFTAARQIGDIAKSHPQDLTSLLKKVSQYLHSKNWDTRVAAAHAIGAIAQNVKHTSLTELFACVESKMFVAGISANVEYVVTWPYFNSKILGSSFKRCSCFYLFIYFFFTASMSMNRVLDMFLQLCDTLCKDTVCCFTYLYYF